MELCIIIAAMGQQAFGLKNTRVSSLALHCNKANLALYRHM